jgi:hypothetical protein
MRADEAGDGYDVVIQWNLPQRGKLTEEWFTKDELERFMIEA